MSAWTEDRDVGAMPADRVARCGYTHQLVGFCTKCGWTSDANGINEEIRLAKRTIARLESDLVIVREALADRSRQLTEARLETRRVEEKLAFVQRALDLHTVGCAKKVCNCPSPFICLVHGKANRS
jgi:hypothetical protein